MGRLSTWSLRGRFLSRLRLCQKTPRARSCLHKRLNHPKTDKRKFKCLRVGFESHEARAIRRTSSMTDVA